MTDELPDEDPCVNRAGICGVTKTGGTGIEWICIRPVHAKVYVRRSSSGKNKKGDLIFPSGRQRDGRPLQADRHLFVPRYPMRPHPNSWRDNQDDGYIGAEGSALPGDSR